MIDEITKTNLDFWVERLSIRKPIKLKRVPRSYWEGNNGRHVWGSSAKEGVIFYSKEPSEATLVHELCHIKWPRFTEEEVRQVTRALVW